MENIKSRKYYRVHNGESWDRMHFVTDANSVDANDGETMETKVGAIKGITTSTSVTEEGYAADATVVSQLNDSLGGLNFAQDAEGNWGYIPSGADSVIPFKSGYKLEKIKILDITTTQKLSENSLQLSALYDGNAIFNPVYNSNGKKELVCITSSNNLNLTITVDKPFKLAFIRTPYSVNAGVSNPIAFQIEDYTSKKSERDSAGWTYIPYFPNGDVSPGYDYLSLGTTFNIKLYSHQTHTGMSELEIYGFYEDGSSSSRPILSPDGAKLEKVTITNITPISTIGDCGGVSVLYDGDVSFHFNNLQREKICYTNASYMDLEITVDKPFKLAYVRTPYEYSAGVSNPYSFTIGGYTSPKVTRNQDMWSTIPYVPSNDKFEFLSLDTTFRIRLNTDTDLIGMSELEIYGFYE